MYLRPRQIFEKFLVEEKIDRLDARGGQRSESKLTGEVLFCVVTRADPTEIEKMKSLHHDVSHVLVQHGGRAKAKVGDRLIGGERKFLVQAVDNPGGIGQWYAYFCNERFDLN